MRRRLQGAALRRDRPRGAWVPESSDSPVGKASSDVVILAYRSTIAGRNCDLENLTAITTSGVWCTFFTFTRTKGTGNPCLFAQQEVSRPSAAQTTANRRNAKKSTGPKTAAGLAV